MATLEELVEGLVEALRTPFDRDARVRAFQDAVANEPESSATDPGWETLTNLATELEFYEPDPVERQQHRSYYGEARLRELILSALRELVRVGAVDHSLLERAEGAS
jgi:hypothetical protein